MLGETREYMDIDRRGIVGDRVYAVRDVHGKLGSGKNTRRFCAMNGLFRFHARYRGDTPEIEFPEGRFFRIDDPSLNDALSVVLGRAVTVAREAETVHFDDGPLHLLTSASLAWLQASLPSAHIDERRFRPNILLDSPGATPVERDWIGKTLKIGDAVRVRVTGLTERCAMVTFAQSELPNDVSILRQIARAADARLGVYMEVLVPGRLSVGDPVTLDDD